jgi:hypothetical protein
VIDGINRGPRFVNEDGHDIVGMGMICFINTTAP